MNYWSFPISYTWSENINRKYIYNRACNFKARVGCGIKITYVPSFQGKNTYTLNVLSTSPLSQFTSTYATNDQTFQHSLSIGICNYLYSFRKKLRLDVEPYCSIGTGYFKDSGTKFNNMAFGVKFSLGFSFLLPSINIEKTSTSTSSQEKINQLKEKQKEIENQLNNKPKN